MACITESHLDIIRQIPLRIIGAGLKVLQGLHRIIESIQGFQGLQTAPGIFAVHDQGIRFLYMRRIRQHNFSQVAGSLGGIHRPLESLPHQFRYQPAVVHMGMSQHYGLNIRRIEAEIIVIQHSHPPGALKHATIYQVPPVIALQQIAGACHRMSRSPKFQSHSRHPFLKIRVFLYWLNSCQIEKVLPNRKDFHTQSSPIMRTSG